MLRRAGSHAAHFLGEAALGLLGVLALAACVGAWRLAQGPIDITALVQREQGLLTGPGTHLAVGGAELAWEGFVARDQPLDIRLRDVRLSAEDGSLLAEVPRARVTLSIGQWLLGRIVPRTVAIEGASVQMQRQKDGTLGLALGPPATGGANTKDRGSDWILEELVRPARNGDNLPWLSQLQHVVMRDASVTVRDPALGVVWQAPHGNADFRRLPDGGVAGQARLELAVGAVRSTLSIQAEMRNAGTHILAATTPLSPSALARAAPQFAALAAVDAPVSLALDAALGPALLPQSAQLTVSVASGTIKAGRGQVALQSAQLVFSAKPTEIKLVSAKLALSALPGKARAPVLTGTATANLHAGRVQATFAVAVDALAFADLGDYLPPGTGGGSRTWLVENIVGGRAHAHVEGALDIDTAFSAVQLTALSGEVLADDVSLYWLRPIPPLLHGRARLTIEGPDSLHIDMEGARQGQLDLLAGSSIEITKLEENHQFGDIDVRLAGPLDNALKLLNHPRLKLLTRSGLDFAGASGQVQAHLLVHLPLEDRVTMDDIRIGATATLGDVHLGKIAAGRDLDRAALSLKVDNDGLALTGHGDFAGIPTDLVLDMDFRDGPASQMVQHVTAHGRATALQLAQAGAPDTVATLFSGGSTALSVDYTARRNHTAALLLDADLRDAALKTPFGWNKAAGAAASAGARLAWDHGMLVDIDHLHAEGPGLLIASHAKLVAEHAHALVLDTLELGRTRARGEIVFPQRSANWLGVTLAGPMLDLSSYFDEPQQERAKAVPAAEDDAPEAPEKRGEAWQAALDFGQVQLAKGKILAGLKLSAESDGLHITRAQLTAGAPGELVASIVPHAPKRVLNVASSDAGVFLRGTGVADNIVGGKLRLDGVFADSLPGDPLSGTAKLSDFNVTSAPAIGRLLQAMTLYGVADLLRGPGLHFSTLVAPYRWQRRVLTLKNARAFSNSLGLTAEGDIDLKRRVADIKGTLVPAYFFNQLLGDLPVVGKMFSPEKGGGVFAARYSVTGPLADPKVGVNPLAALTPGFLREGFGLFNPPGK